VMYLHRREEAGENTKAFGDFKAIPFMAYSGIAKSPAFSPDGSQIAFAWNGVTEEGGNHKFDIYLKVTGSENLVRLTNHPADSISLAWSPDGAQIAFQRLAGSDSGVYLVPALGGPERRLRSTRAKPFGLSWSPDGQWIAFTDSPVVGGNHSLNLISVESLETRPFPHTAECQEEIEPAFSLDGKELAYRCITKPGSFALYRIDPEGWTPHLIGRYAGWPAGLAWSRDNQKLVIGRHVDGNMFSELDEIAVSNGQLRKLPFGERGGSPAISTRGDKLAFEMWHYAGIDIWRRALIPAAASAQKIIASTQASLLPQYSPDGKYITFTSNRTGTYEIWMSNADGTGLVQISKLNNAMTGSPRWSPDGRRIVFDSRSEGRPGVYIVDIEERVPRRVRTNLTEMSQPSWSHDGKWVYFVGGTDSGRIFRCPAEGGKAEALSNQSGSIPQEAPGRDEIYFVTNLVGDPVLKVISLRKPGTESMVEGMPSVNFANWSVVPEGIFFFPSDRFSLEYFDFGAKKASHVMDVSVAPVMGFAVSRDRRSIIYAKLQQADCDIMVVERWQ
jgi:Tol biopolymer transport system component